MRIAHIAVLLAGLLSAPVWAQSAPLRLVPDQDYTRYEKPLLKSPGTEEQVEVIYFFWYGSPMSYEIDKELRNWAATRPYPIKFLPSPAYFGEIHQEWGARIFFALDRLGEERRLSPLFLEAVQKEYVNLSSMESILNWMQAQGVSKEEFLKAINHPSVISSVAGLELVMDKYDVKSTPTIVINGEYMVRVHDRMPAKRVLDVVKFMVERFSQITNKGS